MGVIVHCFPCSPQDLASAQAWVPGTYALWGRRAWEAGGLHEVPLGLALQSGGARQRDVRLQRE